MTTQLTDHELDAIEAGIDNMDYSGVTVQRLIDEVRRQRAVLDQVDASSRRIEQGIDRVAAQNEILRQALEHLDRIIAIKESDSGLMPLLVAINTAKAWRQAQAGDQDVNL